MATSSTAGAPKTPIHAASRTGVGWGSGGGGGGTKRSRRVVPVVDDVV